MSGFFGCVSRKECVADVFYGTDYHSHLGTKKAGMAFYNGEDFVRSIHSIESAYFRNKFEPELGRFIGSYLGIGVISDMESQPITVTSHLGRFAVVTVGRIDNLEEISAQLLKEKIHFAEMSGSAINPTEVVSILINKGETFKEGIENVYRMVKGSCSFLILTDSCIYAARDKFGRTPIIIGKNEFGYVVASESSSFTNLGYNIVRDLGPHEAIRVSKDGITPIIAAGCRKQICSFLWVYYGYPSAYYEGINVEDARYRCGAAMAKRDELTLDFAAGIPDSGVGHAIGYSNEKGIPYKRPFVLDLLREDGEPSGQVRWRTLVHLHGDWHRTSHVWVVRKRADGGHDLLLQKRSGEKDSFAGCYDISSAGHIPAGQDYLESALRELKEELGITAKPEELRLVGVHDGRYEGEFGGQIFKNHEKSHVFVYEKPVEIEDLKLQKEEVESVKWMKIEDVLASVKAHDPGYCLFEDEIEMLCGVLK